MIRAFAQGVWFYAEPATRECLGCIFDNERSAVQCACEPARLR